MRVSGYVTPQSHVDERARSLRHPTVLVGDDEPMLRRMLALALAREGFTVIEAEDGRDMVRRMSPTIDLVIADERMPMLSGLQVLTALRAAGQMTPFILMTAFDEPQLHVQAQRLGAACVLEKLFDLQMLCTVARRLVRPAKKPMG